MIAEALEAVEMGTPDSVYGLAAVVAVQFLITAGGAWHAYITQRRGRILRADVAEIKENTVNDSDSIRADVREIKENTVNSHESNLRHDIDRLIDLAVDNQKLGRSNRDGLSELRGEVRGLTHRVDQVTTSPPRQPRQGW